MTHGFWCNTRTFPTKCPTCGAKVFFFSCDCESARFFDELGPPWPAHDCDTSWARDLQRTTDPSGRVSVRLSEYVTVICPPKFAGIDPEIIKRTRRLERDPPPIVNVQPSAGERRRVLGTLREIYQDKDPLRKLGLDDTPMSRALLGPICKQPVGQITVHAPKPATEQQESFTAFVPSVLVADGRIRRGIAVTAELEGVQAVGSDKGQTIARTVWFCGGLYVVG